MLSVALIEFGGVQHLAYDWQDFWLGGAIAFACFLPLYAVGWMGAADVKLMAVVGAFAGAATVAAAVLYTMLAGGLLSLLAMRDASVLARVMASMRAQRHASSAHAPGASPLARTASRLPYAVAIAMGTAAALIAPPLI